MSTAAWFRPETISVNRSKLRQQQRECLRRASGRTVLRVTADNHADEEKYVLDKLYFEELLRRLASTIETLEIMTDRRLLDQILAAAGTLAEDVRRGKLHSLEEAFEEQPRRRRSG